MYQGKSNKTAILAAILLLPTGAGAIMPGLGGLRPVQKVGRSGPVSTGEVDYLQALGKLQKVSHQGSYDERAKALKATPKKILPAVVKVVFDGHGTGFFIDPSGIILTAKHVVAAPKKITLIEMPPGIEALPCEDGKECNSKKLDNEKKSKAPERVIVITTDKRSYIARVIARSPDSDLALLKIESVQHSWPFLTFTKHSSEELKSDSVLAFGYPYDAELSYSAGIIGGINREHKGNQRDRGQYIQTDADINSGKSGGPLVELYSAEVVGVNSWGKSRTGDSSGVNFAVSIETIRTFLHYTLAPAKARRL